MIINLEHGKREEFESIGLKGACLGEMSQLGLNIPPGFVVTTRAGMVTEGDVGFHEKIIEDAKAAIVELGKKTGRRFGGSNSPLLVSVRSGSAVSMPGMMDSILNLGMNEKTIQALLEETGDERFVYDSLRRFLQAYGQVVLNIRTSEFDKVLQENLSRIGVFSEEGLNALQMKRLSEGFLKIIKKAGHEIPEDPIEQLTSAVAGIFDSWMNPRAVVYRKLHRISDTIGTAAIVQAMVFGNMSENSASGVVVTRDPIAGTRQLFGEYLMMSQGEDVLSGSRIPRKIKQLQEDMPVAYNELAAVAHKLEEHYRDVQEIEFTIQKGILYLLQSRTAPCTAQGKIKITVDLVEENVISREEAVMRIKPELLDQILHSYIDPNVQMRSVMRGLATSPGAASGAVVFTVEDAVAMADLNRESILVRPETNTDDVRGVKASIGVLTEKGGVTSHAAVVTRKMGKPCVTGCDSMHIDLHKKEFRVGDLVVRQGDIITIDGGTGRVFLGSVPMRKTTISQEFREILSWADEYHAMEVRANADSPEDVHRALEFGAQGVGLCRTEAMFMAADRLPSMRAMILENRPEYKQEVLKKLLEIQKKDFIEIFKALDGKPVTIRLLDPPLHEFLPNPQTLMKEVAILRSQGETGEEIVRKEELLSKIMSHQETNPMLGLRGCRLGLVSPQIIEIQVSAIIEAACELVKENIPVSPEIMVPLVGHVRELQLFRERIDKVAEEVMAQAGVRVNYQVGVLIEVPRAALTAGKMAGYADFFSFGTNDLTQTTFAFSRDDAEAKFLHHYHDLGILDENPFETIDTEGVGRLLQIAVADGRQTKPNLKVGICGEQGGEPHTIAFCYSLGMNFVSCSPYRVPIARLAAAQACISARKENSQNDQ